MKKTVPYITGDGVGVEIPKRLHLNRVKPLRYTTAQTKKKGENKCQI